MLPCPRRYLYVQPSSWPCLCSVGVISQYLGPPTLAWLGSMHASAEPMSHIQQHVYQVTMSQPNVPWPSSITQQ